MREIKLFELTKKHALVARESARVLQEAINQLNADESEISIDFAGVEAVTPSFVDETLLLLEETLQKSRQKDFLIIFRNVPTRLSAKFEAIGRARSVDMRESDTTWTISGER